jgi:pimeloyl-ACP methyl ester carboxylesterase
VRELFGRLNALASASPGAAPRASKDDAAGARRPSRLHTHVIGHSFGASIVFRALSQSIIDSFGRDLDGEVNSITRFVDTVVLINPAIEASRFEPVRSAAMKRVEYCKRREPGDAAAAARCERPRYQGVVLAVFTSEGDLATKLAFPVGATLSNTFERIRDPRQATAMNNTIGWDDSFRTHDLKDARVPCDQAPTTGPHGPIDGLDRVDRIDAPGWAWCLTDSTLLQHLPTSVGRPTYNGPFWVVRVDDRIVRDHNDIWNPRFRSVLLRVFADEQRFPTLR